MKFLALILLGLACINAFASDSKHGKCALLHPGEADINSYECLNGTWGVTYEGYSAFGQCWSSVKEAIAAMKSSEACVAPGRVRNYGLLVPGKTSNDGTQCRQSYWGVTFNGYLLQNSCYQNVDDAIIHRTAEASINN